MHGFVKRSRRSRQSARRHFRRGERAAARRAVTAAGLYIDGGLPSLRTAAESCGSNVGYVQAATWLLRSENPDLLNKVLAGHVPVLTAAAQVRRLAQLVDAYRAATSVDRVQFVRAIGATEVFEEAVSPAV